MKTITSVKNTIKYSHIISDSTKADILSKLPRNRNFISDFQLLNILKSATNPNTAKALISAHNHTYGSS